MLGTIRKCQHCGEWHECVKDRRMNTAYVDDHLNFMYSCSWCYRKAVEYWQERWHEYWSSVI